MRIRQRRSLSGMSRRTLANAVGLTFQQVQKYERGSNRAGSSRLFDFAKVLGVPASYFFDGNAVKRACRPADVEARPQGRSRSRRSCNTTDGRYGDMEMVPHRAPIAFSRINQTKSQQRESTNHANTGLPREAGLSLEVETPCQSRGQRRLWVLSSRYRCDRCLSEGQTGWSRAVAGSIRCRATVRLG
ncbi:MAG: helix-turn-helix transcriptional regulator [Proteobacteria bacterium]|nr:helix-turn-helix transcriptional regulator [Pseudomonadota bacterium]